MFLGTIPATARPILHEIVAGWQTPILAVGCSGNFTIERTMADLGAPARRVRGRINMERRAKYVEGRPCAKCGEPATELDHIVPLHKGGPDEPENYQALCTRCHEAKSTAEQRAWVPGGSRDTDTDSGMRLLSCDVSLYSYALGSALSGQQVDIELSERGRELAPWAAESFGDADSAAMAIMLLLDYAPSLGKPERVYSQHVLAALAQEWPELHSRALEKFRAKRPVRIASYFNGDVRQFIADLPADTPFMSFPPFYKGGYEKMFQTIGELVEWPKPTYELIDDNAVEVLLETVKAKSERWCIGLKEAHPPIAHLLRGLVEKRGAVPMYIYASEGPRRYVPGTRTKMAPVVIPSVTGEEQFTTDSTIEIVPCALPYFEFLRAKHLSHLIAKPATPAKCALVLVDGQVAGAFGIMADPYSYNGVYLLSDFSVSRSGRMSKLVLYAVLSREAQLLMQQTLNRRIRSVLTTAFSEHPTSMKYRGLFKLVSRKPLPHDRYQLNYSSPTGRWTLREGFETWLKKR